MLYAAVASLFFAGAVLAETPSGFSPNVTAHLEVKYGSKVVTPGLALTKSDTGKAPVIGTVDEALNGTYIFVILDVDVPGQYAGLPAGSRAVNLHGLVTGYTSATTATDGLYVLSSKETGPASYLAPGPPPETPPHPHKYIELLIPQPEGFVIPASQTAAINKRIGFNLTTFAADAKLGEPVRANWFTQSG